jgi:hypothetical protein
MTTPYWEFNKYTNFVFPQYELPFTGGVPGTFKAGKHDLQSVIPGSGPAGVSNNEEPLRCLATIPIIRATLTVGQMPVRMTPTARSRTPVTIRRRSACDSFRAGSV